MWNILHKAIKLCTYISTVEALNGRYVNGSFFFSKLTSKGISSHTFNISIRPAVGVVIARCYCCCCCCCCSAISNPICINNKLDPWWDQTSKDSCGEEVEIRNGRPQEDASGRYKWNRTYSFVYSTMWDMWPRSNEPTCYILLLYTIHILFILKIHFAPL